MRKKMQELPRGGQSDFWERPKSEGILVCWVLTHFMVSRLQINLDLEAAKIEEEERLQVTKFDQKYLFYIWGWIRGGYFASNHV